MTDDEYQEFLEAVALEYLRLGDVDLHWHPIEGPYRFRRDLERIASAGRLTSVAEEQPGNQLLLQALGSVLKGIPWYAVKSSFEDPGILQALEDHGEALVGEFRVSSLGCP